MNKTLHTAGTRGHANHGWLDSHHTFSFAGYFDPERIHFGALRVLNDDIVAGGRGFGMHQHENMEIISIPLDGELEHRDSMGNKHVIGKGDIQVMSAGSGIAHSEYNRQHDHPVSFLQIWVIPREKNVTPRYDQAKINPENKRNEFVQIVSPNPEAEGIWIHQDAWFHIAEMDKASAIIYTLKKKGNGVYLFVLDGKLMVEGETLSGRDGLGLDDTASVLLNAVENSRVLIMEVPMHID